MFIFAFSVGAYPVHAFTFVAWGDTKDDTNTLKSISPQVVSLNPVFDIYSGDLESDGFTQSGMDAWKNAINGGTNNGLFDRTLPVRGNHDDHLSNSASNWANYYSMASTVQHVGGTNYTELNGDLTYSFDYENSRFIGVDVVGDSSLLSSAQISWIDGRLTDAESKGLTHAFIYFHGPIYCVAEHCSCSTTTGCVPSSAINLISVINKHPIVTATFHGHEHVMTYTRLTNARIPQLTRTLDEFVAGDAGAGPDSPISSARYDYWMSTSDNKGGFLLIDVNGPTVTVNFYHGGNTTAAHSVTLTKSSSGTISPTQAPTSQPSNSPTQTANPTSTRMPFPTPTRPASTRTPAPTRTPTPNSIRTISSTPTMTPLATDLVADANGDTTIDEIDYVIWLANYGTRTTNGKKNGDFSGNGVVDGIDYVLWMNRTSGR